MLPWLRNCLPSHIGIHIELLLTPIRWHYNSSFGLCEDIIRCIFALTYAKDPQFIPKVVQGKGIYRTKFQENPLAFQ